MPTLFRLLTTIVILIALAYAAMYALATFVTPRQTEIVVPIPPERLDPS
ncbi:hypothetical protein [Chelativorans sp. J32]|nr:hypothetical protein [Chelativorans sp. J32]